MVLASNLLVVFQSFYHCGLIWTSFGLLFLVSVDGKDVKHSPCIHNNFRGTWKFGIHHSIDIGSVL